MYIYSISLSHSLIHNSSLKLLHTYLRNARTHTVASFDFAAFICNHCAEVHKNLQQQDTDESDEKKSHSTTTAVHPLTKTPWSASEVSSIVEAEENTKALKLLEHHIPKKVRAFRPVPDSLTQVRTQWIRAKISSTSVYRSSGFFLGKGHLVLGTTGSSTRTSCGLFCHDRTEKRFESR